MRQNIFNKNGKLIGVDYTRENGQWSHRWIDSRTGDFERGSWTGKAKGEEMDTWTYVEY